MLQIRARENAGWKRASQLAVLCLIIFLTALFLRLAYQDGSAEATPLRADSAKYITAAFNFYVHGAYSLDAPSRRSAPTTRTDLPPGYPLFLTLFFDNGLNAPAIAEKVRRAQAVLGALTAVLALLLAAYTLPLGWAVLAGLLTAINPHLIALSELVLTETLFTFLLVAGLCVVTPGWLRGSRLLVFFGMLILGLSAEVRTIGLLVPLSLLPLLAVLPSASAVRRPALRAGLVASAVMALALVWLAHQLFERAAVLDGPAAPVVEYVSFGSPLAYLQSSSRPPRFAMNGDSHVLMINRDPGWKEPTEIPFAAAPLAYASWNLVGRWYYGWHFDNAYNGDVNIYPMRISAFDSSVVLGALHGLMRALHWPLYLLALLGAVGGGIGFVRDSRLRDGGPAMDAVVVTALAGVAFLIGLSAVAWLPRYSIPLRPLSYVLALVTLYTAVCWWKHRNADAS